MPITITRLFSFEGPNIINPASGVLLEAQASRDISAALRNAIKDVGQQVGMVIAALDIQVRVISSTFVIRASFATPTPGLGKAAIQYIVDGLNARDTGDESWDGDEQLEVLQERRRVEALPFAALQIVAEANHRGLPCFRHRNGIVQIGYGARSFVFDPAIIPFEQRRDATPLLQTLPWGQLGTIPIIAINGATEAAVFAAAALAAALPHYRFGIQIAADFYTARELLGQPDIDAAVLELAPVELLRVGLPFDQCLLAAIGIPPNNLPDAHDQHEIARAMALPLLVATGQAILVASPPVLEFAAYAACPVAIVEPDMLAQSLVEHAVRLIGDQNAI